MKFLLIAMAAILDGWWVTTPGSKKKTPYTTSSATPMDVNCSVIVGKHYGGGESNVWFIQESFVVTLSIFRNIEKLAYGHHKT
jgi:hypothetical protein